MSAHLIDAVNTTTNVAVSCYKGCWVLTLFSISALGLSFKTYLHLSCISHSLPHACLEMTKNPLPCMCENQIRSFFNKVACSCARKAYRAKRGTASDSDPTDSWDSMSSSCSWQACCTPARSAQDTQWSSSHSAAAEKRIKRESVILW